MNDPLQQWTRSDNKLGRLPGPVLVELVAMGHRSGASQDDLLAWLKKQHGISSSRSALSQQWTALVRKAQAWERQQKIAVDLALYKTEHPEVTDEELFLMGQRKFSEMAIADEDAKAWAIIQKTERDKEQSALERQKFQRDTVGLFLKWYADKTAKEIAASNLPTAEKTERLGQRLFGDLWQ